jgi:hypothetical protein
MEKEIQLALTLHESKELYRILYDHRACLLPGPGEEKTFVSDLLKRLKT